MIGSVVSAEARNADIRGLWLTENGRSVVSVYSCEAGAVCGRVHWVIEGGMSRDVYNPDPVLRDRPMCGLQVLSGFHKVVGGALWEDGEIYKADDGEVYSAYLKLRQDGTLKVRGFVGVSLFGKTQVWQRIGSDGYPACG